MAGLDLTSFDSYLKIKYPDGRPEHLIYTDNPLFAWFPKMENFGGKSMQVPFLYGNPNNRSTSLSTALSQSSTSKVAHFNVTRSKDYAVAFLDNETMEASMGNSHAFDEAFSIEYEGAFQGISNRMELDLFGDGSGAMGQVSQADMTKTTLTLADPDDAVNFELGMTLVVAAAKTGGSVRSGTLVVTGVNALADSDHVTFANALNDANDGIPTIANGDWIFQEGDYGQKIKGLAAWLPVDDPASNDSFFGLNRSAHRTRMAGIPYDGSGQQLDYQFKHAMKEVARLGGAPKDAFVSFDNFQIIADILGAKVEYQQKDLAGGKFNFSTLMMHSPKGELRFIAARNCPNDRSYLLDKRAWKFCSLGKAPKLLNSDGLKMLRQSNADGVELRIGYYGQPVCRAPGWNAVVYHG